MNGLAKITIDGREVVLKFGLPAVRRIMEKMLQYPLMQKSEENEIYNDLGLSHILYAGYINGCMMRDEIAELPFELFYTFIEDGADDKAIETHIVAAIKAFEDSKVLKNATDKLKEEVEKKSHLNGTISNHSPMEN